MADSVAVVPHVEFEHQGRSYRIWDPVGRTQPSISRIISRGSHQNYNHYFQIGSKRYNRILAAFQRQHVHVTNTTYVDPTPTQDEIQEQLDNHVEPTEIECSPDLFPVVVEEIDAPPKRRRYEGSDAQKMDLALMAGGTWDDIAEAAGKPIRIVRAHAKFRVKGGKYKLVESGDDHVWLWRTVA